MTKLPNILKLSYCFRRFSVQAVAFQKEEEMGKKAGFYAVRSGHQPGVYLTWPECESQVKGFSGASYKKFQTHEMATQFVNEGKQEQAPDVNTSPDFEEKTSIPPSIYSARLMPENLQPTPVGLPRKNKYSGLPDQSEPSAKLVKIDPLEVPEGIVHVYTDGACTNNGRHGAKAGIGVYWGPDHPLNVSERLPGRQTNNRAEIHAAVRALQQAKYNGITQITVYTDSIFLINGVTKWINKWKYNGWKLANGQPVINREDFEELEAASDGLSIKWVHVPGHQGIAGNEAADYLAVQGMGGQI